MTHQHLSPAAIERLIDGLSPTDDPSTQAHLEACAACRGEVEAGQRLVAALEGMPDFAPRAGFADRVMQEVHVFEPWYVTLGDLATRWLPATTAARAVAIAGLAMATGLAATGMWWLLGRADMAFLLAQFGLEQLQTHLATVGRSLADALLGAPGREVLSHGITSRLGYILLAFVSTVAVAVMALRTVAIDPIEDE
jgi:anti-sigma factor RsiW